LASHPYFNLPNARLTTGVPEYCFNYIAAISRLLAKGGAIVNNILPGKAAKQWAGEQNLSAQEMGLNNRQKLLDQVVKTFSIPTGSVGNI